MKKTFLLIAIGLLYIGNANAFWGMGSVSCGNLISNKNAEVAQRQIKNWALGYISGRNFETDSYVGRQTDANSIYWTVVKYCEENPLDQTIHAMEKVYLELKSK